MVTNTLISDCEEYFTENIFCENTQNGVKNKITNQNQTAYENILFGEELVKELIQSRFNKKTLIMQIDNMFLQKEKILKGYNLSLIHI